MNTIAWRADYLALFGQIRRARKAQKMTQVQAAAIIGMTERSYRDIENGHKDIGAENLFRLCAALGIRVFDPQAGNRKETSGAVTDAQAAAIRREVLGLAEAGAAGGAG